MQPLKHTKSAYGRFGTRSLILVIMALLSLTQTACTTYKGYPALIPLPATAGAGAFTTTGVNITPITVQSNGVGTSYTIITPVSGK
jgi:hypothetical protein